LFPPRSRWRKSNIYTLAGDILLSLNPYKQIEGAYENPHYYFNLSNSEETQYHESLSGLPPHVYLIANRALRSLVAPSVDSTDSNCINQSVIISGESGAGKVYFDHSCNVASLLPYSEPSIGKTEASKYVINFLVQANHLLVSSPQYTSATNVAVDNIYTPRIKDLIHESSIIFESFGNAKTLRNDNSSRFGKYIKLQYSDSYELISATTETFLLEQSRLISVGENERNYHIFYQMLRGLRDVNADLFRQLRLGDVSSYRILTMGNCTYANMHVDDAAEFHAVYQALYSIGCSDQMIYDLYRILASILHLGNAVVLEAQDSYSCCEISIPGSSLNHIARMLGVDADTFLSSLVTTTLTTGSNQHTKPLSALESTNNINAVIKWLYFQVFSWLVSTINKAHSKLVDTIHDNIDDELDSFHGGGVMMPQAMKFIGILDIFGFEISTVNSFEQLCINYTNERLQQQFNDYVFKAEQEVYAQEGLDWKAIAYSDNQNIIDVIAKKPTGLLHLLEEFSLINRAPDDTALLSVYNQHHEQQLGIYQKSRFRGEGFSIRHYAGIVSYKIDGFITKNNNSLQEDINELLSTSENTMLKQVHDTATSQTGQDIVFLSNSPMMMRRSLKRQSSRRMSTTVTVSLQFRQQLDHLIRTLSDTRPHYIKCIKPNDNKQANLFNWSVVASQLRYSGVLEVVRIRREGYPIRLTFQAFYEKFFVSKSLFRRLYVNWPNDPDQCSIEELKAYCHVMLKRCLKPTSYQIGVTTICLHENGFNEMQRTMDAIYLKHVMKIQSLIRSFHHRWSFKQLQRSVIRCQSLYRGRVIRRKYAEHYANIVQLRKEILDWCEMRLDSWRAIIREHYLQGAIGGSYDPNPSSYDNAGVDIDVEEEDEPLSESLCLQLPTPLALPSAIDAKAHEEHSQAVTPVSPNSVSFNSPPPPPTSPIPSPPSTPMRSLSPKSSVRFNDVDIIHPFMDLPTEIVDLVELPPEPAPAINGPEEKARFASPVSVSSTLSPTNSLTKVPSVPPNSPLPPRVMMSSPKGLKKSSSSTPPSKSSSSGKNSKSPVKGQWSKTISVQTPPPAPSKPIRLPRSSSNPSSKASIIQLSSITDPLKRAAEASLAVKLPTKSLPYYLGRQPSSKLPRNKILPDAKNTVSPNSTASVSSSSAASISSALRVSSRTKPWG
jgi:myosin V